MIAPRYSSGASMVRRSVGSWILPLTSRCHHLRFADGELEALHAASARPGSPGRRPGPPRCRPLRREHAQSRTDFEAVLDQARGDLGVLRGPPTGQRGASVPIVIEIAGSSTWITAARTGFSASASVSPIMMSGMPMAMHVAGAGGLAWLALERLGDEQLGDLDVLHAAVGAHPHEADARCPRGRAPARAGRGTARRECGPAAVRPRCKRRHCCEQQARGRGSRADRRSPASPAMPGGLRGCTTGRARPGCADHTGPWTIS